MCVIDIRVKKEWCLHTFDAPKDCLLYHDKCFSKNTYLMNIARKGSVSFSNRKPTTSFLYIFIFFESLFFDVSCIKWKIVKKHV